MKNMFQAYHPYVTYSNEGKYFARANGKPSFEGWSYASDATDMSHDAQDLWRLGKKAYGALGEIKSREEFDEFYGYHLAMIRDLRLAIAERVIERPGATIFVNLGGEEKIPDFDELSNSAIVDISWQIARQAQVADDAYDFFGGMFLFTCLEEINNTIVGMCCDGDYAVSGAIAAAEAYANYQAIASGNDNLQRMRSEAAARAAIERYKRDPKQAAKAFAKECWEEWQNNLTRYKTQTAFANDVLTKVDTDKDGIPIISFDTIVKKWIPTWAKKKK